MITITVREHYTKMTCGTSSASNLPTILLHHHLSPSSFDWTAHFFSHDMWTSSLASHSSLKCKQNKVEEKKSIPINKNALLWNWLGFFLFFSIIHLKK